MEVSPSVPVVSALRSRYEQRSERLTTLRQVKGALVSLAGLIGRPVLNQSGEQIGRVVDVVARWDSDQAYPPVTGVIVRVGRRRAWLPIDAVQDLRPDLIRLHTSRVDLRDFTRRHAEVELAREVVDHQLVDTDGACVGPVPGASGGRGAAGRSRRRLRQHPASARAPSLSGPPDTGEGHGLGQHHQFRLPAGTGRHPARLRTGIAAATSG